MLRPGFWTLAMLIAGLFQSGVAPLCSTEFSLIAKTDRTRYAKDDKMVVTYYALNDSDKPLFIYPPPPIWDRSYIHPSGSDLDFWQVGTQTQVPIIKRLRHGVFGHIRQGPVSELVEKNYYVLGCSELIGAETTIDLGQLGVKPGEYEISVTIFNDEPTRWSPDELKALRFPIFCGTKQSARVKVVVE